MKNSKKISMLGGDRRQLAVAKKLAERYGTVSAWGISPSPPDTDKIILAPSLEEAISDADIVILPLPVSTDTKTLNCPCAEQAERPRLLTLAQKLPCGALVIGGRLPDEFIRNLRSLKIKAIDYFLSESFQYENAYTTAEAALSIAMNSLDRNIRDSHFAITGFGRIAKHLCLLLRSFGAEVTVAARRESDLALAESLGCRVLDISSDKSSLDLLKNGYDVIYNTAPSWLFERDFLLTCGKSTLIVDLASAPGGVDICAAKELGANVIWATSLPGKYAPRSAGELIADVCTKIIERGDCL